MHNVSGINRGALARLLLITCFCASLLAWQSVAAPSAAAAGCNMANQGDCAPGYPQGASWLNWWGYFALSWGQTDGWMDYYSASGTIHAPAAITATKESTVTPWSTFRLRGILEPGPSPARTLPVSSAVHSLAPHSTSPADMWLTWRMARVVFSWRSSCAED